MNQLLEVLYRLGITQDELIFTGILFAIIVGSIPMRAILRFCYSNDGSPISDPVLYGIASILLFACAFDAGKFWGFGYALETIVIGALTLLAWFVIERVLHDAREEAQAKNVMPR